MLQVRKAKVEDLSGVYELNKEVHEIHAIEFPEIFKRNLNQDSVESFYKNILAKDNEVILVCEYQDNIKGYCIIELVTKPENMFFNSIKKVYLHHIGVAKNSREKGVGKALIQEVLKLASDYGANHVGLDTWAFNKQAISFFESCGFVKYNQLMWLKFDA